jgi:hypothetical protein
MLYAFFLVIPRRLKFICVYMSVCSETLAYKIQTPGNYSEESIKQYLSKTVPLQAWSGPEGSRKFRFPDYMTTAQGGGKVVSHTHWPPLPPGNTPGTHFF